MKLEKFISIGWYMDRKPYPGHTAYDTFYLHICRDLFGIVSRFSKQERELPDLDEEQCRELAWILASYFEDRVTGIGFWRSLTELHRQHFGKRLPFFEKEALERQEGETDDILREDIWYLIYLSYINLMAVDGEKPVVPFGAGFFLRLSQAVFDYLDAIEEVETTTYYDEFLEADNDYFVFKRKLDWFTFGSYLTSVEFNNRLKEFFFGLDEPEERGPEYLSMLTYTERDRLMIDVPSALTGFFPADILAGALRGREQQKQEVRNLKWRVQGIFRLDGQNHSTYAVTHSATGERFSVRKSSLMHVIGKEEAFWAASLVSWNGSWHFTGTAFPIFGGVEQVEQQNNRLQYLFQRHFPAYRQKVQEVALDFRNAAAGFFGTELLVVASADELQDHLRRFSRWYVQTKTGSAAPRGAVNVEVPEEVRGEKDLALFIPPQDGFTFVMGHSQLSALLQSRPDTVPFADREDALQMFAAPGLESEYWMHLRKQGVLGSLSHWLQCPLEDDADFEGLLRIYHPADFSPLRLPAFTLVNFGEQVV